MKGIYKRSNSVNSEDSEGNNQSQSFRGLKNFEVKNVEMSEKLS